MVVGISNVEYLDQHTEVAVDPPLIFLEELEIHFHILLKFKMLKGQFNIKDKGFTKYTYFILENTLQEQLGSLFIVFYPYNFAANIHSNILLSRIQNDHTLSHV